MSLKNLVIATSTVNSLIASATVAVDSTLFVSLANATLYDPVPITVVNSGAIPVLLGGSTMTSATGLPVAAAGSMSFTLKSDALFAATSGSTGNITVLSGRQF